MAKTLEDRLKAIRNKPASIPNWADAAPKKEEPIHDIRELGVDPVAADRIMRLTADYHSWAAQEREAKQAKGLISNELKTLCNDYGLTKVMVDDLKVSYYPMTYTKIDKGLLLAQGVKAETIAKCTVSTKSMAIRVSAAGQRDED